MAGIGIVTNPHSRRNRRFPEQYRRLAYVLGEEDESTTTRSVDDIEAVARQFKDANIDILALNGGDGTNHVTLSSFLRVYGDQPLPLIALLRGGTLNTVSNAIGIRGKPNSLLVNIVEKYYLKEPFEISERDLITVKTNRDPAVGFLFGTGLVSNFMREYYGSGKPSAWTAAKLIIRGSASAIVGGSYIRQIFRPNWVRATIDGSTWWEGDISAIMAATIEQIGLGFRPWVRCEARPHTFHLLAIKGGGPEVLSLLPTLRVGRSLNPDIVQDTITDNLVLESDEPIEYTIDGDLYVAGNRMELEVGPRLRIIIK